jgi:hypothetical protein
VLGAVKRGRCAVAFGHAWPPLSWWRDDALPEASLVE